MSVGGKIGFALWNFVIWVHFYELIPSVMLENALCVCLPLSLSLSLYTYICVCVFKVYYKAE
jgi:hypothetical protein